MRLRLWVAVVVPAAATSAPAKAAMPLAPVRRAVVRVMTHAAVAAAVVLVIAQRMKTVARVWVMRHSAPSAKPLRMHSTP